MAKNFFLTRRKLMSVTQRSIALRLGITESAVGSWERGEAAPSIERADELASIYDVSEDEMLRQIKALRDAITAAAASSD